MKTMLLAITLLLSLSFNAFAVTGYGDLTYVAPTERVDNTALPLSEIDNFIVFRNGVEVDASEIAVYPLPNSSTGFTIKLNVGKNDFNIVTVDTEGWASGFSATVSLPWASDPKPASNFTGQIRTE